MSAPGGAALDKGGECVGGAGLGCVGVGLPEGADGEEDDKAREEHG